MPSIVLRSLFLRVAAGLLALVATPVFAAPALTVSPAMGRQGASISVSASGLAASTSYDLEYSGTSVVRIATLTSDLRGRLVATRTLPALPAGSGKMQLRTQPQQLPPSPGRIVVGVAFRALTPMVFTPSTTTIHAGQSLGYRVDNLTTGYLTILYEGRAVVGPVAVGRTYSGKFIVPTDRPAPLPANADIRVVNSIGRSVAGTLDVVLPVRAKLASPFRIGITTPPPTLVKPSQPFQVSGELTIEANEVAPDAVSLWYFGDDGAVFPLAATRTAPTAGGVGYTLDGKSGGARAMTAGVVTSGRTALLAETKSSSGVRGAVEQQPSNAQFDGLPDDRWRIRVRAIRQDTGQPLAGVIVQFEGAPVAEPEGDGLDVMLYSDARQYVAHSTIANQLVRYRATDDQGCPLTLARQLTDSQGYATFEFTDDELALAQPKRIPSNPGEFVTIGVQMIGIDASAQGYGFQFPQGHPQAGDFLPHIYEVQFLGAGDGVPAGDTITFVDYYQPDFNTTGGRDFTYNLVLPKIQTGVALYDTSIKPWIAHLETGQAQNGGAFPAKNLSFGPITSRLGINSAWISPASTPFPTQISVRTDPAVSGSVSSRKLYFDVDRNGSYEYVRDFTTSGVPLNCTIQGLDKSLTWTAPLPAFETRPTGRVKGYVEFIGANTGNKARQNLSVDIRQKDLSWLSAAKYGSHHVEFRAGGQVLVVRAMEDSEDAAVQLGRDPGHEIGRLRNETENSRMIDLTVDVTGHTTVLAPLDGEHEEAGRGGAPTILEPSPGVAFSDEFTLIDQSFPLFYYVWGVPVLAGIEVGANFSILAEIDIEGEFIIKQPSLEPALTVTTTPQLDLGLNFYVDIDVLFDLVDGGVDLDAVFALDMPIVVEDNRTISNDPCFTASLIFSWHFEVFCLPLDFVCDALNDIEGSETLLSDRTGAGCSTRSALADKGTGRNSARIRPNHSVVAFSPVGAGLMAFTRDDSNGGAPPVLVARPVGGGDYTRNEEDTIVSTQPGIRSIDIAFFDDHEAVMVWAESADDYPTLARRSPSARLARQRLMFSRWDGERWSAKAALTAVSGGEGGVDLAACPAGAAACPADGEVLAVWTRDMASDIRQHRTRIYTSRFRPASASWIAPVPVDGSAAAMLDSSPSATYVAGQPLAVFVRSTSGVFSDTDARRVAYRFVGSATNTVQVPATLPGGVAWPSAAALPSGGFVIVHTHADDPKAFVGNTQRIASAYASGCAAGACAMQAQPLTDPSGRAIYGERPTAVVDDQGHVNVVLRGVGFGNDSRGIDKRPGDPIGMALHTGDLVSVQLTQGRSTVAPIPLTADGAGHFAPNVGFDPSLGQTVVTSTLGDALSQPLRERYAKSTAGEDAPVARAKAVLADPGLEVMGVAQGVDLAVVDVIPLAELAPGASVTVRVAVRNLGTTYTESGAPWLVRLGWDAPYDAGGTLAGSAEVAATLRPGEARLTSALVTVPAGFTRDEPHALFATLVRNGSAVEDIAGENDTREHAFGGMPMPFGLNATAIPGANLVQLTWDPVPDPNDLVAGFRIWHHDGDGVWKHLGSSFEHGFVDLSPAVGVERSYRVTSYSANAVESPPSPVAAATLQPAPTTPPPGGGPDPLFSNGFE